MPPDKFYSTMNKIDDKSIIYGALSWVMSLWILVYLLLMRKCFLAQLNILRRYQWVINSIMSISNRYKYLERSVSECIPRWLIKKIKCLHGCHRYKTQWFWNLAPFQTPCFRLHVRKLKQKVYFQQYSSRKIFWKRS